MSEIININTNEDVDKLIEAIASGKEFELGEVKPIKYKLVLDGGRFENFDPKVINADIAKIILSVQTNYDKILSELEEKYGITIEDELKKLSFTIEKGSGIIETLLESSGVLKKMESKHLMFVLVVAIISFAGVEAYSTYMEKINTEIISKKEIRLEELAKEDRQSEREAAAKYFDELLDITKQIAYDKTLQDSINKPKRDVLSVLNDDEYIKVSTDEKIKTSDKAKYNYKTPVLEDIEETVTETHVIETYNFIKPGKLFKFKGIGKAANSETLAAAKRIKLMQKADNKEEVKVKLKYVKHPTTKAIKSLYIVDYIEN